MASKLWELFWTFARIGVMTFGGGYAMLPILQREIVDNKHWADEAEMSDYYAIGQCTPGSIAVNVATFIGRKEAGVIGGIVATLGQVFPCLVIICIIAGVLDNFADFKIVQDAFGGIRACVCVLIFNAVLKLFRSGVADAATFLIFLVVLIASACTNLSPVVFVVAAGVLGVAVRTLGLDGKGRKEAAEK